MLARVGFFIGPDNLQRILLPNQGTDFWEVEVRDCDELHEKIHSRVEYFARLFDQSTERTRLGCLTFTQRWDKKALKMNRRKKRDGVYRIKRMLAVRIKELLVLTAERIINEGPFPMGGDGRLGWSISFSPQQRGDKECRVAYWILSDVDPDSKSSSVSSTHRSSRAA